MVFQSMQSNLNNKKQFLQHFKLVHYKKTKKNTHQNLRHKYRKMSYRFCNAFCLQHHNFFLPYLVKPTHNQCCNPPPNKIKANFALAVWYCIQNSYHHWSCWPELKSPPPKKNSVTLSLIIKGQIIAFNVYDGRRVTERCIGVCNELSVCYAIKTSCGLWKLRFFFTYILIPGSSFSRHILLD